MKRQIIVITMTVLLTPILGRANTLKPPRRATAKPNQHSRRVAPTKPVLVKPALVKSALPKPAPPLSESDAVFNRNSVLTIEIELSAEALNSLRNEPRKYVEATLKEGNKIYNRVGVHLRGAAGSFQGVDDKPGITFNMDKFVKKQRFCGMEKFHLANSVQDPTYSTELLCGEIFREAGVPAARIAHATLSINGRKCGMYSLKEGYDKQFLMHHFNDTHGSLYDGGFLRDLDQPLELLSGKKGQKEREQVELKALADASKEPKLDLRFNRLSQLLDMNRFLTYIALEAMLWDWDGYPMNRNNYRVYHDLASNKIVFIPSGMDQMFGNVEGPILPDFQGMIARSILETPEGRECYFSRMRKLLLSTVRVEARLKRLVEVEAKIKSVLTAINKDEGNGYGQQMEALRDRIRGRFREVGEQLKKIPVTEKTL
ncbi:hypothetical protein LBMAG21_15220 [Armatimonadota bacterium]|nr:hypothetical protein LBMAG21_15220 [Armatimonadota bacterium]